MFNYCRILESTNMIGKTRRDKTICFFLISCCKNLRFFDVFREYRNGPLSLHGLILLRDHSFSTYTKFSEKLMFLTP